MRKKTRDTIIVVGVTLAVAAWMLPGTFEWAKAKYFGSETQRKKAAAYGEATRKVFAA